MKPHGLQRKVQGFTLVEVLLAMAITSIALLGILALQTMSIRAAGGSRGRETAVYLTQTILDNVQAEAQRLTLLNGYAYASATSAVNTYYVSGTASGTSYYDVNGVATTSANKIFTVAWKRKVPRDATPNCYEFEATTTWSFETDANQAPIVKTIKFNRLVRILGPLL